MLERCIAGLLARPVGVAAFYILIAALAVAAALRLPVTLLPPLTQPSLVVWTGYADVAPERVERAVTRPVEDALAGTNGSRGLTSRSQLGGSWVRIDFGWNTDLELASLEVRRHLDRLVGLLPEEAERPILLRVDPGERPILILALSSAPEEGDGVVSGPGDLGSPSFEISELARHVVARRLEQVDGVARVRLIGAQEESIEVELDMEKLAALGLEVDDVNQGLARSNIVLSGGSVRRGHLRYAVEVSSAMRHREDVASTVVSPVGRAPIRLRQVATVSERPPRRRGLVRLDGRESLLLRVERRLDANTLETARQCHSVIAEMQSQYPRARLAVIADDGVFVAAALRGTLWAIVWGGLLAVGVLLLFLRRPSALLAVGMAVPLSLALTLVFLDLVGISINLLSLSGLALGVGLLVDNAIVIVESISRLREEGATPQLATCRGTARVAGAITGSTLTTLAVFLPLRYMDGLAGRLFHDQSLAVACSLIASLVVALTAVPLLACRDLRKQAGQGRGWQSWQRGARLYEGWLIAISRRPALATGVALGLVAISAWIGWGLPRAALPQAESGRLVATLEAPPGTDLSRLAASSHQLEAKIGGWPGVRHVLADLGERDDARLDLDPRPPHHGELLIDLEPGASPGLTGLAGPTPDPSARLNELATRARDDHLRLRPQRFRNRLEALLGDGESDLWIDVESASESFAPEGVALGKPRPSSPLEGFLRALADRPELRNVRLDQGEALAIWRLHVDREAVYRFGAREEALRDSLETLTRGREVTRLHRIGREVPVRVRAPEAPTIKALLEHRIPLADPRSGKASPLLPLGAVLVAEAATQPAIRWRSERLQVTRLRADLSPGVGLRQALAGIETASAGTLSPGVRTRVGGATDAFAGARHAVGWSLLWSLLLVYLILAAQFDSLIQPIAILAILPLALAGTALALAVTSEGWNLMSLTGCVVMVGIAVNDAILKLDRIRQLRSRGLSLVVAVRRAGIDRLRPITMTTLTTGLGLLPLVLGYGVGANLRAPLAIAIVGGLLFSTLATLLFMPLLVLAADKAVRAWQPNWPGRGP